MSKLITLIKEKCIPSAAKLIIDVLLREGVGSKNPSTESDLMRVFVKYCFGGIYLDTDISYFFGRYHELLKNIEKIDEDFFRLLKIKNLDTDAVSLVKNLQSRFSQACSMVNLTTQKILTEYQKDISSKFLTMASNLDIFLSSFDEKIQSLSADSPILGKLNAIKNKIKQIGKLMRNNVMTRFFPEPLVLPHGFMHSYKNNFFISSVKKHPILHAAMKFFLTDYKHMDTKFVKYFKKWEYYCSKMDLKSDRFFSRNFTSTPRWKLTIKLGPTEIGDAVLNYQKNSLEHLKHSERPKCFDPDFNFPEDRKNEGHDFVVLDMLKIICDKTWVVKEKVSRKPLASAGLLDAKREVKIPISFDDWVVTGTPQIDVFKPGFRRF